jgi:protoheme IX farnesyltransferase
MQGEREASVMVSAASLGAYWRLTKPRIWGLLVFTGVVAMLVAYRETGLSISPLRLLAGAVALTLGSAAANTLTNYHDRDIDGVMKRTRSRPLPSGQISPPWKALVFGLLMASGSLLLSLWFNGLAFLFMLAGLLDNVVVYSILLKRRSWLNIILGGISGGMPVLVGYSAVAGTVSPIAIYMSALVIVWIPTHIWSLAITSSEDYMAARVPMLPVVFGDRVAAVCIAATSSMLAVFSIAIFLFTSVSLFYTVSATLLGAMILGYSAKLAVDKRKDTAWTLFKLTSPYLALIFTAVVLDVWLF